MKININPFIRYIYMFNFILLPVSIMFLWYLSIKNNSFDFTYALLSIMLLSSLYGGHYAFVFNNVVRYCQSVRIGDNNIKSYFLGFKIFSGRMSDMNVIIVDHVERGYFKKVTIAFSKIPIKHLGGVRFWHNYNPNNHFIYKNPPHPKVKHRDMLILRISPKQLEEVLSYCPADKVVELYPKLKHNHLKST